MKISWKANHLTLWKPVMTFLPISPRKWQAWRDLFSSLGLVNGTNSSRCLIPLSLFSHKHTQGRRRDRKRKSKTLKKVPCCFREWTNIRLAQCSSHFIHKTNSWYVTYSSQVMLKNRTFCRKLAMKGSHSVIHFTAIFLWKIKRVKSELKCPPPWMRYIGNKFSHEGRGWTA